MTNAGCVVGKVWGEMEREEKEEYQRTGERGFGQAWGRFAKEAYKRLREM